MIINKELVTRVVDNCYSSCYKIFSINSKDGVHINRSTGLFVSLGITTSVNTMRKIKTDLSNQFDTNISIAEIESRLINGRYSNVVTKTSGVEQYDSGALECGEKLGKDDIDKVVSDLKSKLIESKDCTEKVLEYSRRLSKVSKLLSKLNSGDSLSNWDNMSINLINTDTEFSISIINNKINYTQYKEVRNGTEIIVHKRIGILIEFK